jgi:hypothetical protein
MECNRAFRERAKICVDWTAPRTNARDGVDESLLSMAVVSAEFTGVFVSIGERKRRNRVGVCNGFSDVVGPCALCGLPRWQGF